MSCLIWTVQKAAQRVLRMVGNQPQLCQEANLLHQHPLSLRRRRHRLRRKSRSHRSTASPSGCGSDWWFVGLSLVVHGRRGERALQMLAPLCSVPWMVLQLSWTALLSTCCCCLRVCLDMLEVALELPEALCHAVKGPPILSQWASLASLRRTVQLPLQTTQGHRRTAGE